jgi:hypothetical protein
MSSCPGARGVVYLAAVDTAQREVVLGARVLGFAESLIRHDRVGAGLALRAFAAKLGSGPGAQPGIASTGRDNPGNRLRWSAGWMAGRATCPTWVARHGGGGGQKTRGRKSFNPRRRMSSQVVVPAPTFELGGKRSFFVILSLRKREAMPA